jgi:hypothetical protein
MAGNADVLQVSDKCSALELPATSWFIFLIKWQLVTAYSDALSLDSGFGKSLSWFTVLMGRT